MDFSQRTTLQYSSVVTAWASGTGGAGILGSFAYAALTDKDFLNMSPRNALFSMNVMVVLFAVALVTTMPSYKKYSRLGTGSYWNVRIQWHALNFAVNEGLHTYRRGHAMVSFVTI